MIEYRQAEGFYCWRRGMGEFLQVNTYHSFNWTTTEFSHNFSWHSNHKDNFRPYRIFNRLSSRLFSPLNNHGDVITQYMFANFPWTITETCRNMKQEYLFYMLQFNMFKMPLEVLSRLISWSMTIREEFLSVFLSTRTDRILRRLLRRKVHWQQRKWLNLRKRSTGQLHSLSSHKNRDNLKPPISWQTIYWIRAKIWNEMRWKIETTATRTTTIVPIFYDRYGA